MEYYNCLCHTLCMVPADCALRSPHWNTISWTLNDGYIFSPEWEFKIIFKGQRNLQGLAWDIVALASSLMVLDLFIYQVTLPYLIYCARAPASLHPKPSLPCFYP